MKQIFLPMLSTIIPEFTKGCSSLIYESILSFYSVIILSPCNQHLIRFWGLFSQKLSSNVENFKISQTLWIIYPRSLNVSRTLFFTNCLGVVFLRTYIWPERTNREIEKTTPVYVSIDLYTNL